MRQILRQGREKVPESTLDEITPSNHLLIHFLLIAYSESTTQNHADVRIQLVSVHRVHKNYNILNFILILLNGA